MCECVSSIPLAFSVTQVRYLGLTTLRRRYLSSTHGPSARNGWLKSVTARSSRNTRVLGSEGSEFYGELGFKEKGEEVMEFEPRMGNDKGSDSPGLDVLELKDEKRSGKNEEKAEEEDLIRVKDDKEIEESGQLNGKVGLRRRRQVIRRSNMLAKQVISIHSALSLGFVSQIWVDTTSWVVLVVEVRPNLLSGESDRFLLEDVRQVGDVILVEDENVLEVELKMVGLETLVGYRVVTAGRRYIGKVRGFSFNVNSGAVELLELDSFGISIIPSSLVSTYALPIEDVLEVLSDTVIVHEAAASRIQKLTKGFWDAQNVSVSIDEIEEYSDSEISLGSDHGRSTRRSSHRQKFHPKIRKSEDDWELPMDYL
ncbi:hypothetical protein P3X46_005171 [Hevea brasiliensis]|uniref:PRC-barrel domain-containing protein n=1 Tax=Hevea brasiliensis TaxID=3981 RepID=A0ABQ9N0C8_HEVBR|nr:uncharacterized protein LOC110671217 [Hevea brasiliensis]KAJ9185549.1 hypothetical protein P3X46_005171 [Hevea brasiliensis]